MIWDDMGRGLRVSEAPSRAGLLLIPIIRKHIGKRCKITSNTGAMTGWMES